MKKFLSLVLAAMMLLAMASVAFAADETPVTAKQTVEVSNLSGHTFKAYQVFTGTQAVNTQGEFTGTLAEIEWGTGIDTTKIATAIKANTTLAQKWGLTAETADSAITAEFVSGKLSSEGNDSEVARAFAFVVNTCKTGDGIVLAAGETTIAAGYYLIVDTTDVDGSNAVANASLLQLTGKNTIYITSKTDKPSHVKKVQENEKEVASYETGEGAAPKMNDVADYNIGDDVPFAIYSKVPVMDAFATYTMVFTDTMTKGLTFNNDTVVKVGTTTLVPNTDYTVTPNADGHGFTLTISDLKAICVANDIKAGAEIRIGFTAELNEDAIIGLDGNTNTSKLSYSNNPNDDKSMGETPEDKVIVFTYELDVTKVDGEDNSVKLKNAEFKLYRTLDNKYVTVDEDGKVTGWVATQSEGSILKSDENGLFKVIGLDDGIYKLVETKAPAGYNPLTGEITVEIIADTKNGQDWTEGKVASDALKELDIKVDNVEADGDIQNGTVSATVENNQGATLPETGGIGTTLFYLFGGLMTAGSALVLVVRRRADADEE